MFTKYCIILLIFITVLLYYPLNVYGMDDTSNSNYGNKSKSIVVYAEQNRNELFVLFKGFVQIRKIKKDGKETLRSAKENEVFMEIFCGDHVHNRHISTDEYGKFEVVMHANDVKENFEKCEKGLNIGFYKYDPKLINIATMGAIGWEEKAKDVRRFFAKVDHFDWLKFSEKLTKNDVKKLEEESENENKENLFEYLKKQFTKQDDENSFQISFKPKYAAINEKEAQILGDKGKYRSYTIYTQMKNTPKSESSSTENQLVKMYKKATTCFGKK